MVNFILILVILIQVTDCFYNDQNDYNIFYTQASNPNIVLADAKDVTIPTEDEILAGRTTKEIFYYYMNNQKYIMHAGGQVEGKNYTNSLEALTKNYEAGNRIFEIDLNFTSDGELVLIHGWSEYDYTHRLGVVYNKKKPVMDLKTFKKTKLYGKYTTMTVNDLIKFMKEHPYSYFILNIKGGSNYKTSNKALKQIVKKAKSDKNILNRMVVWGYNSKVLTEAKKIYDFELIALNVKDYSKMEKSLNTKEEIINFCKKNKITVIMYQYRDFKKDLSDLAGAYNIKSVVYTVESSTFAKTYFDQGVSMAFTNKLKN